MVKRMDCTGGKRVLLGMSQAEMSAAAVSLGLPAYTGSQIAKWIYRRGARTIAEMTDLSKEGRQRLDERFCTGLVAPLDERHSADGTVKYLFPTADGKAVESVFIPDGERATLCVSSQAGCKMNCLFCHTGKQGFHGNLSAGDILNQVYSLPEAARLTNIVFMGQGEPADNLAAVLKAAELLQAPYGMAWSPKRITISTAGVKGKLTQLVEESNCHLAVSLHAARADVRARLMPVEKGMPAKEIIALLRRYDWHHQRRLTFEYILFDGVNDTDADARALALLLRGLPCRVNIIRYHEAPGIDLRPSSEMKIQRFAAQLNARGLTATIRASRGADIAAACGQLTATEQTGTKD
ncbi:MAG: 23S rRNA (adenine(2503)-C(2))-methyltransferase RlmN [Prevotella sp.]|nr:23S rRNA (adenine(2503)-C(2))-methyltransferase RlmN [Prevotella sp.]